MQKVLYLLTLLLITVYTYADVSPVVINRLTNNEGLSNSSVNVIYQDSNNLMWFGTWDGLNLYNSREFKTFKPNPNVPGNITNNIIRDIIETTKGRLWITTDNGINLYTPEAMRFQSFFYDNKENSIFKERSFLICKNSHNKVIASVYNTGLYYFDEELSDFILIRNLKETSLKKLFFDKDDNLWLFTDNNSLYRVNLDWSKNKPDIKDIKPVILSQSSHDVFYNLYTNQIWEQNENRHINIYDVPTETKITEIPFSKVISSIIFEKTGYVIGVKAVTDENEIMMITTEGIIIQIRMDDVSQLGRITSGVKLINLDAGVTVAQIAKVREKVSDGNQEFDDVDDAMEDVSKPSEVDQEEDDDPAEEHITMPEETEEDE